MTSEMQSFDRSTNGAFVESPLNARDAGMVLYACHNAVAGKAFILDTSEGSFGATLTSASLGTPIFGIGGTESVVMYSANVVVPPGNVVGYLDPTTLAIDTESTTASEDDTPQGIGGDLQTIWHNSAPAGADQVHELAHGTFATIRSAAMSLSGGVPTYGIGGDSNVIWACAHGGLVYEFSTSDLSQLRNETAPKTDADGIGGSSGRVWHTSGNESTITSDLYELSPVDLSMIREEEISGVNLEGCGGQ